MLITPVFAVLHLPDDFHVSQAFGPVPPIGAAACGLGCVYTPQPPAPRCRRRGGLARARHRVSPPHARSWPCPAPPHRHPLHAIFLLATVSAVRFRFVAGVDLGLATELAMDCWLKSSSESKPSSASRSKACCSYRTCAKSDALAHSSPPPEPTGQPPYAAPAGRQAHWPRGGPAGLYPL